MEKCDDIRYPANACDEDKQQDKQMDVKRQSYEFFAAHDQPSVVLLQVIATPEALLVSKISLATIAPTRLQS
jgi:hypothetical protein